MLGVYNVFFLQNCILALTFFSNNCRVFLELHEVLESFAVAVFGVSIQTMIAAKV